VTGAPVDLANMAISTEQTVERLLWYNVYSTNDAKQRLGGNPYDNSTRQYSGSLDDVALNARVFTTTADIAATTAIASSYQTTGRLAVPLTTMHTTLDPVVPYWHAELYGQKVAAAGGARFYTHQIVPGYGHCAFQPLALLSVFNSVAARANERSLFLPAILK
jgi:hypothetical protein